MLPFESGRRLCLLAEAGRARVCLAATSVVEVTVPPPGTITVRGGVEVRDLSVLLGGPPEQEPGMVLALDVSPTLIVRVRRVIEVAELASAPPLSLPLNLSEGLRTVCRGAILHRDRLYLELLAEVLPRRPGAVGPLPTRRLSLLQFPTDRALIFESQGRLLGVPLLQVLKVVLRSEAFGLLPASEGPLVGLQPQDQRLWPIYSVPALLGGAALPEPFCVLAELDGRTLGLSATRVLGVYSRFRAGEEPGTFLAPGLPGPALFLDWPNMDW